MKHPAKRNAAGNYHRYPVPQQAYCAKCKALVRPGSGVVKEYGAKGRYCQACAEVPKP